MFNTEDSNELKSMYKGIDELTELFHKTDSRVIKDVVMDAIHSFMTRMTNIKSEIVWKIKELNKYANSKLTSMMDEVYPKDKILALLGHTSKELDNIKDALRTVDKTDENIKPDIPNDSELDADTYNKALAFLGHNLDHNSKEYIDIVNMLKTVDKTDKNIKPDEDSKDDSKHIDDKEDKESVSTSTDDSDATIEKFLSMIDDAYTKARTIDKTYEDGKDDSKHTDDKKDKESASTSTDDFCTTMEKIESMIDLACYMLRNLNETYEDGKDDSKHTDDKKAGKFDKNIEEVIRSLDKYLGSMMDMKKNNDEKSDN